MRPGAPAPSAGRAGSLSRSQRPTRTCTGRSWTTSSSASCSWARTGSTSMSKTEWWSSRAAASGAASSRRWCGGGGRGGRGPRREPARLRHRRPGPRRCLTRSRARCREIRYCNASAGRPASSASSGTEPAVLRGPSRSSISEQAAPASAEMASGPATSRATPGERVVTVAANLPRQQPDPDPGRGQGNARPSPTAQPTSTTIVHSAGARGRPGLASTEVGTFSSDPGRGGPWSRSWLIGAPSSGIGVQRGGWGEDSA